MRPLFELAEDSEAELNSYLRMGRVLVARIGQEVIGHLQLVTTEVPGEAELKSMAVRDEQQGRGVGARLIRAARMVLADEGARVLRVSTAAASAGNLRFYQRQGFRLLSIERDAFTALPRRRVTRPASRSTAYRSATASGSTPRSPRDRPDQRPPRS